MKNVPSNFPEPIAKSKLGHYNPAFNVVLRPECHTVENTRATCIAEEPHAVAVLFRSALLTCLTFAEENDE